MYENIKNEIKKSEKEVLMIRQKISIFLLKIKEEEKYELQEY